MRTKHWSEKIVEEVVKSTNEPFVVASGITTSGPTHLGTLCEFLYPSAVYEKLLNEGYKTEFLFQGDIMDAFDGIPANLKNFEEKLKPYLGKPLCDVPDPFGCCKSYGEHFLNEAVDIMDELVSPKIIKANEQYQKGLYDKHAELFLKKFEETKKIIEETSFRVVPGTWNPLMVVCENCGRIATTRITDFNKEIRYVCDLDVGYTKGCGYSGHMKIKDHRYKLVWRLDWPSKWDVLNVTVEGAGKDHFTRGGSADTGIAISRRILKKEPPVSFKFGFITIGGKKYSKSAGLGMGVREILDLMTPELLKYVLFKPQIEKDKDIVPTGNFLMKAYDEYTRVGSFTGKLSEADEKRRIAYRLSGGEKWKLNFSDLLIYYQLYKDWNILDKKIRDKKGLLHLKTYAENWVQKGMIPPNLRFEYNPRKLSRFEKELGEFAAELKANMSPLQIHELAYTIIEKHELKPKEFFSALYETLIGKKFGPRIGILIHAIGPEKVRRKLSELYH